MSESPPQREGARALPLRSSHPPRRRGELAHRRQAWGYCPPGQILPFLPPGVLHALRGFCCPVFESTPQRGAPPPFAGVRIPRAAVGELAHQRQAWGYSPQAKFSLFSPEAPYGASGGSDVPCPNRLRKGRAHAPLCGSSHPPRSRRGARSPAASVGILPLRGKFSHKKANIILRSCAFLSPRAAFGADSRHRTRGAALPHSTNTPGGKPPGA